MASFEHFLAAVFECGVKLFEGNVMDRSQDQHLGPSGPTWMNPGWKLGSTLHASGPNARTARGPGGEEMCVSGGGGDCLDGP